MAIHAVFDVLAWSSALLIRLYYFHHGDFANVSLLPGLRFRYKITLLFGASIGAIVCGTSNVMIQYPNLLGHSVLGAILGGVVAVELFKWKHKITGSTGVVWVVPLAVGIAVGRLGCFFSGLPDYTYGIQTNLPWGVDFGDGIMRHPVQLYESAAMLVFAVTAIILIKEKNVWFHANGFYLFAIYYGGQRFLWEFLKPYAKILGPFNLFHFLCLVLIAYGLTMMHKVCKRRLI